ncbi:hypothetical protein HPB50_020773 [Hyalomma asiaticum]|uniref:Uncharacterized protein n=1 Tax=Hyalomma asiaticum TaxID=266040 RepID=A0ACB7RRB4_HYAAI|nr:hypothetical protein HPB50_020773 [Hyalomma asiaticum]
MIDLELCASLDAANVGVFVAYGNMDVRRLLPKKVRPEAQSGRVTYLEGATLPQAVDDLLRKGPEYCLEPRSSAYKPGGAEDFLQLLLRHITWRVRAAHSLKDKLLAFD